MFSVNMVSFNCFYMAKGANR